MRSSVRAAWATQQAEEDLELEEFRALETQIKADVVGAGRARQQQPQQQDLQQQQQQQQQRVEPGDQAQRVSARSVGAARTDLQGTMVRPVGVA